LSQFATATQLKMIYSFFTIMAFLLAVTHGDSGPDSRNTATRASMMSIETAIQTYEIMTGEFPKDIEDLTNPVGTFEKGILKKGVLNDAWGTPFQIKFNGDEYEIRSAGPDKIMGTADDLTN